MDDSDLAHDLHWLDHHDVGAPKTWVWGRDYGKDILADLNQLAHTKGTDAIMRDALQRAHREIRKLRSNQTNP